MEDLLGMLLISSLALTSTSFGQGGDTSPFSTSITHSEKYGPAPKPGNSEEPKQATLSRVHPSRFEVREHVSGKTVIISAPNLGEVPYVTEIENSQVLSDKLQAAFRLEPEIFGDAGNFEYRVTQTTGPRGSHFVRFGQVVGKAIVEGSLARIENGNIRSLRLISVDPNDPMYDSTNWLDEATLIDRTQQALKVDEDLFEGDETSKPIYKIVFDEKRNRYVAVAEIVAAFKTFRVDAVTGAILSVTTSGAFDTQCTNTLRWSYDYTLPNSQASGARWTAKEISKLSP